MEHRCNINPSIVTVLRWGTHVNRRTEGPTRFVHTHSFAVSLLALNQPRHFLFTVTAMAGSGGVACCKILCIFQHKLVVRAGLCKWGQSMPLAVPTALCRHACYTTVHCAGIAGNRRWLLLLGCILVEICTHMGQGTRPCRVNSPCCPVSGCVHPPGHDGKKTGRSAAPRTPLAELQHTQSRFCALPDGESFLGGDDRGRKHMGNGHAWRSAYAFCARFVSKQWL